jgi:hypothetical protein
MSVEKVVSRSLEKAFRDVALTVVSVAGLGLAVLADPNSLTELAAALPGIWGSILVLVVPILAKAGIDAINHRDKM